MEEARREARVAILCLGATLMGLIAGSLIPVLPFACAVVVAVVFGSSWAIVRGVAIEQVALSGVAMLIASQVGYGFGLVLLAIAPRGLPGRRLDGDGEASSIARQFWTGNRPR